MASPPSPRPRTQISTISCTAYAYPSTDGIIHKDLTNVELAHLNLPPTTPTFCDENPAEEEIFALRILQLGGRWWPSLKFMKRFANSNNTFPYSFHYPPDSEVGYTSTGGMYVLHLHATSPRLEEDLPDAPEDWARLSFAQTMEQRCEILKEFGAVFYEDWRDCGDLPKTVEERIREGRKYEELLEKWSDIEYLDGWLNSL